MKRSLCFSSLLTCAFLFGSWGFFAHKQINRTAVFTLPDGMIKFYKNNISYITEHAVDADKRRYADTAEASRHYIDADRYGAAPFDSLPPKWLPAVTKYSEKTLKENGILPWQIERSYYALVKAFQERDSAAILRLSSSLGHYIGDAHVPLHTTENYNGQLTGQVGIHAFWESRLPELFSKKYNLLTGQATYIDNPLKEAWRIVRSTYQLKDSVLLREAKLSELFPSDLKYAFSQRNGQVIRQYSEEYAKAYDEALKGMVQTQIKLSIAAVGSFWYSAWIDAGQPDLGNLERISKDALERRQAEKVENLFKKGKILGRSEN
ncbi:S1/P1 Nuclease [Flavihumibacter sp. R14]|nr:S1/P1 Nuclease [Flavihumibacter soli]